MNELIDLTKEEIEWNNKQDVDMFQSSMTILGNEYKNNYKTFDFENYENMFDIYIKHKKVKKHLKNINEFEQYKYLKPIFHKAYNCFLINKSKNNINNKAPSEDKNYGINYICKIVSNRNIITSNQILELRNFLLDNYSNEDFYDIKFITKIFTDNNDLVNSINSYYKNKFSS